ncbi:MAG: hypothetical protein ACXAD7_15010 [Candidatus Kariarchaeaceae archaeon]
MTILSELDQSNTIRYVYNSPPVYFTFKDESLIEEFLDNIRVYSGLDLICYQEQNIYILFFTKTFNHYSTGFVKVKLQDHFCRAMNVFDFYLGAYGGTRVNLNN